MALFWSAVAMENASAVNTVVSMSVKSTCVSQSIDRVQTLLLSPLLFTLYSMAKWHQRQVRMLGCSFPAVCVAARLRSVNTAFETVPHLTGALQTCHHSPLNLTRLLRWLLR
jgi:hypothetical protein